MWLLHPLLTVNCDQADVYGWVGYGISVKAALYVLRVGTTQFDWNNIESDIKLNQIQIYHL